MENVIELGPLLGIENDEIYTVCILLNGIQQKVKLYVSEQEKEQFFEASYIHTIGKFHFYRFEFTPFDKKSKQIIYKINNSLGEKLESKNGEENWTINRNPEKEIPDIAFVSCNGTHTLYPNQISDNNFMGWKKLKEEKPELLFLTGDQVYADTIFDKCSLFKEYYYENSPITAELEVEIDNFYLNLYIDSWTKPYLSDALATIPNVMTWDDHDIIDGFGSHRDVIAEKLSILYKYASKYYELFQIRSRNNNTLIHLPKNEGKNDYSCYLKFRNYSFALPDTRSFRSKKQILTKAQYDDLTKIGNINILKNSILCVVLPVPIAHMDFTSIIEKLFVYSEKILNIKDPTWITSDDTIDHWDHFSHKKEQVDCLETIFNLAEKMEVNNLIILSGDVHSAGAATISCNIDGKKRFATQLITSPIVNQPPSEMIKHATNFLAWPVKIVGNFICELKHFGSNKKKLFYKRNFLILKNDGYLVADLFVENTPKIWSEFEGKYPYRRTINNFVSSNLSPKSGWYYLSKCYNWGLNIFK